MITVELSGGLGNQMFQYALGRALSISNNTSLLLDMDFLLDRPQNKNIVFRNFDLDIFQVKYSIASKEISKKHGQNASFYNRAIRKLFYKKTRIIESNDFKFNSSLRLKKSDSLYLSGYWQNIRYFEHIEEVLRTDFMFLNPISKNCDELLDEIQSYNSIAINFRRTDFVHNPTHGVLGLEFYKQAILEIKKNVSNPVFYIFSDDIDWCHKNLYDLDIDFKIIEHFYAGDKFRNYLELMINCKHFIIPNSSFAWWAAWLSKNDSKLVFLPKIWVHNIPVYSKNIFSSKWNYI